MSLGFSAPQQSITASYESRISFAGIVFPTSALVTAFLRTLPERQRQVFLARYFYALPLSGIAARFSMRENTVKTTLHRTRRRLRDYLEQEELL